MAIATKFRIGKLRWLAAAAAIALAMSEWRIAAGQTAETPPTPQQTVAPQLVIIDTDIGDDIDDAFALALALRSPELRILGITTDFGETALRARLVDRYLAAVGRAEIPVAVGKPTPESGFTQGAYARQEPPRVHAEAVPFLLGQIRAHPGQITLIAIGPLVNVQEAIARDPATFRKLNRVVMMGGSIYRGYDDRKTGARHPPDPEWNIRCDPEGAKALLASRVPVYMMPLDSTQIHLEPPQQAEIFSHGSPLTDQLTLLYHEWSGLETWRTPTLFDPVAVSYAIRPALCPTRPMRLAVDSKGYTRPVSGPPNAQVCLQSDEKGFLSFLLRRIIGEPVAATAAP